MVVLLDPDEDHDDILRANRSRERKYMFDVVSDARAEQQEVYAGTAKTLLGSVLEGYNATVFAYGATGKINEIKRKQFDFLFLTHHQVLVKLIQC